MYSISRCFPLWWFIPIWFLLSFSFAFYSFSPFRLAWHRMLDDIFLGRVYHHIWSRSLLTCPHGCPCWITTLSPTWIGNKISLSLDVQNSWGHVDMSYTTTSTYVEDCVPIPLQGFLYWQAVSDLMVWCNRSKVRHTSSQHRIYILSSFKNRGLVRQRSSDAILMMVVPVVPSLDDLSFECCVIYQHFSRSPSPTGCAEARPKKRPIETERDVCRWRVHTWKASVELPRRRVGSIVAPGSLRSLPSVSFFQAGHAQSIRDCNNRLSSASRQPNAHVRPAGCQIFKCLSCSTCVQLVELQNKKRKEKKRERKNLRQRLTDQERWSSFFLSPPFLLSFCVGENSVVHTRRFL